MTRALICRFLVAMSFRDPQVKIVDAREQDEDVQRVFHNLG